MIAIYEEGKAPQKRRVPSSSFLEVYKADTAEKRPFMIVLPGGGYNHLAEHEGREVAERLRAMGLHVGVFYYQLAPVHIDLCLKQLDELIAQVRQGEGLDEADPQRIGIIGFSAGGHLAALASTKNEHKPDVSILCYPVITMEEPHVHVGSRTQILGERPTAKQKSAYSPEQLVTAATPKTYLWHAVDDQSVPVENAWMYMRSLKEAGVPCESHFFAKGGHGKGLAQDDAALSQWVTLLETWLRQENFLEGERQ